MTDHRRRAEELIGGIRVSSCHDSGCPQCSAVIREKITEVASALKEVEEETFARAVGVVEKRKRNTGMKGSASQLLDIEVDQILSALREEVAKK